MKRITIYTDGGSRGNPGPSAMGAAFCNENGEIFKKYSEFLGEATNKKFKALFGRKIAEMSEVIIKSDSELLVRQLNGEYKITEPRIGELFLEIWNLKIDFKKVKFTLIPREKNKTADRLVNEELDAQGKEQKLI